MNRDRKLTSPGSSQAIDLTDPGTPISLLDHQWRSFQEEMVPLACSEIQVANMKLAFYAGAKGVLNTIDLAFAEELPPEEVGKVLPAIGVEIDRWCDSRRQVRGEAH